MIPSFSSFQKYSYTLFSELFLYVPVSRIIPIFSSFQNYPSFSSFQNYSFIFQFYSYIFQFPESFIHVIIFRIITQVLRIVPTSSGFQYDSNTSSFKTPLFIESSFQFMKSRFSDIAHNCLAISFKSCSI